MERFNNAVDICHGFLRSHLSSDSRVIDATVGNGHDLLFASTLTKSVIYGFDIQEAAIRNTLKLLGEHAVSSDRICLFQESHEAMSRLVHEPVTAILFNLGYLPGGDKTMTTRTESTIAGLHDSLKLLLPGGIITVVAYPGHPAGMEEYEAVRGFTASLSQRLYNVVHFSFPNQRGNPPEAFVIESRI